MTSRKSIVVCLMGATALLARVASMRRFILVLFPLFLNRTLPHPISKISLVPELSLRERFRSFFQQRPISSGVVLHGFDFLGVNLGVVKGGPDFFWGKAPNLSRLFDVASQALDRIRKPIDGEARSFDVRYAPRHRFAEINQGKG